MISVGFLREPGQRRQHRVLFGGLISMGLVAFPHVLRVGRTAGLVDIFGFQENNCGLL